MFQSVNPRVLRFPLGALTGSVGVTTVLSRGEAGSAFRACTLLSALRFAPCSSSLLLGAAFAAVLRVVGGWRQWWAPVWGQDGRLFVGVGHEMLLMA